VFEQPDGSPKNQTSEQPEKPAKAGEETTDEPDDENHESTSVFSRDYLIAEAITTLPDGTKQTTIVAESLHYGNACYVLRGDVLSQLSETIGQPLDWKSIFSYFKVTARQLGARSFHHTIGGDLVAKVSAYLSSSEEQAMSELASKWLTGKKMIYDDDMHATRWNRLPRFVRDNIEGNLDVRARLEAWANAIVMPARGLRLPLSKVVNKPKPASVPVEPEAASASEPQTELDRLSAENARLQSELDKANQAKVELEAKLRQIQALLGQAATNNG